MIAIRSYLATDRGGVLDVLAQMRGETYPGDLGGQSRDSLSRWLDLCPPLQSWVADCSGVICGHVQVAPFDESASLFVGSSQAKMLEVSRLFVAPFARGRGTGTGLLNEAEAWITSRGCIPVLRVSDYLVDAIRLYETVGWLRVGETASLLNNDRLLVLTKKDRASTA